MNKFTDSQKDQARSVLIAPLLGVETKGGMPCPICGGDDRFSINKNNKWFCRICGDGKYWNTVDLIMRRDNLKFNDAVAYLLNSPAPSTPAEPDKQRQTKPLQNFIDECRAHCKALPNDASVLAYATGRGLTHKTLRRFGCGAFTNEYGSKGLTFAYVTEDRLSIPSVRYRLLKPFTNKKGKLTKNLFIEGSSPVIPFGLQALTGRPSLVIVEGEINAMSIAQSADVDVLSFGSDSIRPNSELGKAICDVAQRYKHVLIWCDKPEVAQRLGRAIPRADLRQSPNDHDANDLLQRGLLADFLARILPSPTPSTPPKVGDSLRTNDGREITIHHIFDCGLMTTPDGKPYRLINGIAHFSPS